MTLKRGADALPFLAPLLALLSAIGPFSIDTYLPAFSAIGSDLQASTLQVQQTLTAFMAPFAFMILWHGALSDSFGRRRVILVSLIVFALASVLCMLAGNIETLWLGRGLQGMSSGAGMVVGRTMIRDLLDGADAQRLMSRVAIMFAISPAVAPIIGGWIYTLLGWRAVFGFLVLFGSLLALLCWRYLPETLAPEQRHPLHPGKLAVAYRQVFSSGAFLLLCATLTLNFSAFFIYVLSAPAFLMGHLGLSAHQFAWLFLPAVTGMMLGSFLSGRLAGKLSQARTIALGFGLMVLAALGNVLLNLFWPPGLPQSVLPLLGFNMGLSVAMPSLTILALDLFPTRRGLVSSCQGFIQSSGNSLVAGIIAPLLWATPLSLALGMAGFLVLGGLSFAGYLRLRPR